VLISSSPAHDGRARPSNRIHVRTGVWLIRDHLSTELDGSTRGRLTELVYCRVYAFGHGLTEVRPLAAFPEQQLD